MAITTEKLAYWYFRLNGFIGNNNFIIHRRLRGRQHATEVDYLGLRFMHRKELFNSETKELMEDDKDSELFKYCPKDKIYICLVEVKLGQPALNESWVNGQDSLSNIFNSLGCFNTVDAIKAQKKIQRYGFCCMHRYYISFIAIGRDNKRHDIPYKRIPIISWDEVLSFIYDRFSDHKIVKSDLEPWSHFVDIIDIIRLIKSGCSKEEFISMRPEIISQ